MTIGEKVDQLDNVRSFLSAVHKFMIDRYDVYENSKELSDAHDAIVEVLLAHKKAAQDRLNSL